MGFSSCEEACRLIEVGEIVIFQNIKQKSIVEFLLVGVTSRELVSVVLLFFKVFYIFEIVFHDEGSCENSCAPDWEILVGIN